MDNKPPTLTLPLHVSMFPAPTAQEVAAKIDAFGSACFDHGDMTLTRKSIAEQGLEAKVEKAKSELISAIAQFAHNVPDAIRYRKVVALYSFKNPEADNHWGFIGPPLYGETFNEAIDAAVKPGYGVQTGNILASFSKGK